MEKTPVDADSFDFVHKGGTVEGLLLPAVQAATSSSAAWDIEDHSGGPIYHDGEVMHGQDTPLDSFNDLF